MMESSPKENATRGEVTFVDIPNETTEMHSLRDPNESTFVRVQQRCGDVMGQVRHRIALVRPWKEFFDREGFNSPSSLGVAASRISYNMNHYYHNYILLAALGSAVVMVLNPLFAICASVTLCMWWFVGVKRAEAAATNSSHFLLGNTKITFTKAYLCILLFAAVSFFSTNGSSVVFWLIASSFGVVLAHAALRQQTIEEQQPFAVV